MAEHRVELMQSSHPLGNRRSGDAELRSEFLLSARLVRHELVQRRVKEADRCRTAFESPEDSLEVFPLVRQQLGECLAAIVEVLCKDHFTHRVDAITFTTLEPGYFFGFTDFDLRLDNITIERTAAAPADLNGDGVVDGADLAILLAAWGPCPPKGSCQADFDGNGVVDGADLTTLLAAWG